VGEAVVMLTRLGQPPLRLLLGTDVHAAYTAKLASLRAELSEWEAITLGAPIPSDPSEDARLRPR
jgi:hypothetical protein